MPSLIRSIAVEHYKSIETRATLELRPLTIIIGRNGSGKSLLTRLPHFVSAGFARGAGHGLPLRTAGLSQGISYRDLCPNREIDYVSLEVKLMGASQGTLRVQLGPDHGGQDAPQRIHSWMWESIERERLMLEWTRQGASYRKDNQVSDVTFEGLWPVDVPGFPARPQLPVMSHLGPFRGQMEPVQAIPERVLWDVGIDGAGAGAALASHALLTDDGVADLVRGWYEKYLGFELRVSDVSNDVTGRYFALSVRAEGRRNWLSLSLVGTGTASVLPYFVQHALVQAASSGDLLPGFVVCEEPEAHLHPASQAELADIAIATARSGRTRVMIETHSETFLLRTRRRVAEGTLKPAEVQVLWANDEGPSLDLIQLEIGEDGWIENWPTGLFAEASEEARALVAAVPDGDQL